MLDALKKLGNKELAAVSSELEGVKASFEALQNEFNTKMEELAAAVAEANSLKNEKSSLEASLAELVEKLASAEEFNKAMAEKALAEKLAVRKQMIVDVIGEAKADATFEAVKNLGDAEFKAVVEAFAASVKAEASSQLFVEVGAAAEANVESVMSGETEEARILKARYKK